MVLKGKANVLHGRVAERLNAPVLKTGEGKTSVGSNPTPSATFDLYSCLQIVRQQAQI